MLLFAPPSRFRNGGLFHPVHHQEKGEYSEWLYAQL
jgi:hypothetical protein